MLSKDELRNALFEKYFEVDDGIVLSELMPVLVPISYSYKELHKILEDVIDEFEWFDNLDMAKDIRIEDRNILIIKFNIYYYLVLDLGKKEVIETNEIWQIFDEQFFISNFNERKLDIKNYKDWYRFYNSDNKLETLIKFYSDNKKVLNLPTDIYNRLKIGHAWTYLNIHLASSQIYLGFQTEDQYLYEQLFLNIDLTPSSMQDAIDKIGIEKAKEMFDRIKQIQIPKENIDKKLYEYFSLETIDNSKKNRQKVYK